MRSPTKTGHTLPRRLEGGWGVAVRAAWLTAVATTTALVGIGFVRAFADPDLVALPPLMEVFEAFGLNVTAMMALALLLPFSTVVAICGVVFWRRSNDPMALLFTLSLLLLFAFSSRTLLTYGDDPVLRHAVSVVFAGATVCLAAVLSMFPDGRVAPRWSRWLPVAAGALVLVFPDAGLLLMNVVDGASADGPVRALAPAWFAILLAGIGAQTHRYRHVSSPIERQQAKWVVLPLALIMTAFVLVFAPLALFGTAATRWVGMTLLLAIPLGIALPLGAANAVLRYRLYEVDRAINRTVSYAILTVVLTIVYVASVTTLGTVVRAVTGEGGGDLVVAASTLTVAALIRPVRRRVQTTVDRRFDRARYDRQQMVEEFAHRLREELDLEALRAEMVRLAVDTVRPDHTSLWLPADRPVAGRGDRD